MSLQHGIFTQALLEGLAGKGPNHYKAGIVTIGELDLYVEHRVTELTSATRSIRLTLGQGPRETSISPCLEDDARGWSAAFVKVSRAE